MRRKWTAFALAGLLLALCGCSLARAEAEGGGANSFGDRFAGVYLYRWENSSAAGQGFYGNPNLTEYGASTVKLDGYGSFDIPDQVLFAQEVDNTYVFPGLEGGYTLFALEKQEEYGDVIEVVSNMAPGEDNNAVKVADGVHERTLSGVVCFGPPLGLEDDGDAWDTDAVWTGYRVYQTEDGRPYLDGSGNSFSGGGGFGFGYDEDRTTTENGESVTERMSVSVQVQAAQRIERLVVTQFDGENSILRSDELALRQELPEVRCEDGAAWVLVEEIGSGETVRTLYSAPKEDAEPAVHTVVLLDGGGLGRLASLHIQWGGPGAA